MEEKDELDDILDEVDAQDDAEAKRLEDLEETEQELDDLENKEEDLDDILDEIESKPEAVIEKVYVVEESPKSVEETVVKKSKPKRSDKHSKSKHKKSKNKRNALIALFVLIVVCGGVFTVWKLKFSGQGLDAFKYVQVDFEGVDTKGTATLEVDLDAIKNPEQKEIYESLTYSLSPQEGLANGNRIKLIAEKSESTDKLLKTHKYRLESLEKEIVVKDLYDSEQFNLFEQFSFNFEGMDGSGTVSYDMNLDVDESYLQTIVEGTTLSFSKDKNLVNGEEITVKASFNKEAMAAMNQHKVKISEEQTTVKVEGLSDVYASMDDIKEYKELQNLAFNKIKADYAKHPDTYTNFRLEYACYAADTQNNVNAVDYFDKHAYSKGSLMFIYSFNRIRGNDVAHFADNYGYTNMVLSDGKLDRDSMLLMSPYQDGASIEKVLNELQANNFKCEAQ